MPLTQTATLYYRPNTMNEGHTVYLQWFWTAFFAGFGLYLLWRPDFMTRTSPKLLCVTNCDDEQRVKDAVQRRASIERISHATGYAGATGAFIIAALCALRVAPSAVLYGVFCTFLALTSASVYWQLRNRQERRVAVLQARSAIDVIPAWLLALVTLSAFSVLTYASVPALRIVSVIVTISTLITIAAAWRLTSLPALLQGVDLNVEVAIDERVRVSRTAGVLMFACVQPFVFASQSLANANAVQHIADLVTMAGFGAVFLWAARRLRRPLTIAV